MKNADRVKVILEGLVKDAKEINHPSLKSLEALGGMLFPNGVVDDAAHESFQTLMAFVMTLLITNLDLLNTVISRLSQSGALKFAVEGRDGKMDTLEMMDVKGMKH